MGKWNYAVRARGAPQIVVMSAEEATTDADQKPHERCSAYQTSGPGRVRAGLRRLQQPVARLAAMLLLSAAASGAFAATIIVSETCSLVDAFTAASANVATGGCPAGEHPATAVDTIVLQPDTVYVLTAATSNNVSYGHSGLLFGSNTILEGNGSTIMRDSAAPNFRVLRAGPSSIGEIIVNDLTISGGLIDPSGTTGSLDYTDGRMGGGGLEVVSARVTLNRCTITGNVGGDNGGGIVVTSQLGNPASLTLNDSTISNNIAIYGGGIDIQPDMVATIQRSRIIGNRAEDASGVNPLTLGGGINQYGTLSLDASLIADNVGGFGGGGMNVRGPLTMSNSTLSGNYALNLGGGIYMAGSGSLDHVTVVGNLADNRGGGLYDHASTTNFSNSVFSGNAAALGNQEIRGLSGAAPISGGHNLVGHSGISSSQSGFFAANATDLYATSTGNTPTALDALLDVELADNGGPTQTHALVVGSPAINGAAAGCPPPDTDQRGVPRPQFGACDIGAFEWIAPPFLFANGFEDET